MTNFALTKRVQASPLIQLGEREAAMDRNLRCALAFVAVLSTLTFDSCGGGSPMMARLQISVVLSASASSIEATGTDPVTAIVTGDDSGKGVTWSVSCSASDCGSVAPGSGAPGTFTSTYSAPSIPPPTDMTITIKAVSVADSSKSGSVMVTLSAITLLVSPSTTALQAGIKTSVIL